MKILRFFFADIRLSDGCALRPLGPLQSPPQNQHQTAQICEYEAGTRNRLVIFDTVSAYCGSATSFFHVG